jgi:hypothetical protein
VHALTGDGGVIVELSNNGTSLTAVKVSSPEGGPLDVEVADTELDVPGRVLFNTEIAASGGSLDNPIVIEFRLDSRLSAGQDHDNVLVFRDLEEVADCEPGPGIPAPDPCVFARQTMGEEVALEVLASDVGVQDEGDDKRPSTWHLAVIMPTPELLHPAEGEEIRVNRPYLNLRNVGADGYDFQVLTAAGCDKEQDEITDDDVLVEGIDIEEQIGSAVTYWQSGVSLAADATYCWRARATIDGDSGEWSDPAGFTIGNVWSETGHTWRWPLKGARDVDRPLSGTFMEGYYHAGNLQTRLHGGVDVRDANVPVRAARSGILVCKVEGCESSRPVVNPVVLQHEGASDGRDKTHYLHMRNLTDLPLGTYVNQGAELGMASNAGTGSSGAGHLHFAVSNADETRFFNPLAIGGRPRNPDFGWSPPDSADPIVNAIYLRNKQFLSNHPTTGAGGVENRDLSGQVFVIAHTVDPAETVTPPPGGRRLAPYRVEMRVRDSHGQEHSSEVEFNELTGGDDGKHEKDYYAYADPRRCVRDDLPECTGTGGPIAVRSPNPAYLMYFRWDTSKLPDDGAPYTITWESSDFYGNSGDHQIRIGPELMASATQVVLSNDAQEVTITIHNRNENLEDDIEDDTYQLEVESPDGVIATLMQDGDPIPDDRVTVANGDSTEVTLSVGGSGSIRVTAASRTINDIYFTRP